MKKVRTRLKEMYVMVISWKVFCLVSIIMLYQLGNQQVYGDTTTQRFAERVEKTEETLSVVEQKLHALDQKMRSAIDRYRENVRKKFKEIGIAYRKVLSKLSSLSSYQPNATNIAASSMGVLNSDKNHK